MPRRDMTFYRVDKLLRLAEYTAHYAPQCKECAAQLDRIELTANGLDKLLDGQPKHVREYERVFHETEQHLLNHHGMKRARHPKAIYSIVGMAIGTLLGWAAGHYLQPEMVRQWGLGGWFLGTLAGRIWGNQVELQLERENRLLK